MRAWGNTFRDFRFDLWSTPLLIYSGLWSLCRLLCLVIQSHIHATHWTQHNTYTLDTDTNAKRPNEFLIIIKSEEVTYYNTIRNILDVCVMYVHIIGEILVRNFPFAVRRQSVGFGIKFAYIIKLDGSKYWIELNGVCEMVSCGRPEPVADFSPYLHIRKIWCYP